MFTWALPARPFLIIWLCTELSAGFFSLCFFLFFAGSWHHINVAETQTLRLRGSHDSRMPDRVKEGWQTGLLDTQSDWLELVLLFLIHFFPICSSCFLCVLLPLAGLAAHFTGTDNYLCVIRMKNTVPHSILITLVILFYFTGAP